MLGVDTRTPGYMVREELQREKVRVRAVMKAWGFEGRLGEGRGSELARYCWKEMRERESKRREDGIKLGEGEEEMV